jgi:hypothetical protein
MRIYNAAGFGVGKSNRRLYPIWMLPQPGWYPDRGGNCAAIAHDCLQTC